MTDLLDRLRKLREGATRTPWRDGKPNIFGPDGSPVVCDPWMEATDRALVVALVNALPQIEAAIELAEALALFPEAIDSIRDTCVIPGVKDAARAALSAYRAAGEAK